MFPSFSKHPSNTYNQVIIGLTLALAGGHEFTTLYIVIIFHRISFPLTSLQKLTRVEAFEGLGLGTRLAFLQLPPKWNWVPTVAALIYSAMTPLGMAIGLGAQGGLVR
jgi:zinc transporter 1/2/3